MAIKKNSTSYAYSIVGVSLVLFLLGIMGWLMINGRSLSRAFKENVEVEVCLHDNTRPENIEKLNNILIGQSFVRETRVITKEEAAKIQSEIEGEDITEFIGANPLFPSIVMKMNAQYVNKDSLEKIKAFILQSNIVNEVRYPQIVLDNMNKNIRQASLILGVVALLLVGIVIVLIDNTVRLAMFSNRFLIKTMQMVGATQSFIARPFDRRAIINGFISGLIATVGLWALIVFAENSMPELKVLNPTSLIIGLMLLMIIIGILISLVSTHRSVVKYLKLHVEDLY